MDLHEVVDAQFEKAVSIVQGLPKTGPIQTGYEEKLAMYSLYKQATVGNVKTSRPGMWDMLGRAKWDAWAKHKNVPSHEAKLLYVQTLLKVLKKYSDKTVTRDLVRELESYGDLAASFTHFSEMSGRVSPTGSSGSESAAAATRTNKRLSRPKRTSTAPLKEENTTDDDDANDTAGENDVTEDEEDEPGPLRSQVDPSFRSPSSISSHMRYRTPLAGSTMSPLPQVPPVQPLPAYATLSAFGGSATPPTIPSSAFASTYGGGYPQTLPYPPHLARSSAGISQSPRPPSHPYNVISQCNPYPSVQSNPDPRTPVERAIENVQAHIAALTERIEMLEAMSGRSEQNPGRLSNSSLLPVSTHSLPNVSGPGKTWDPSQMGLWSLVIGPLTRITESLRGVLIFLMYVPSDTPHTNLNPRDPRYRMYARARKYSLSSPALLVVRRLLLDISFLLAILGFARWLWKKTGFRRKNVYVALGALLRAILGTEAAPKPGRTMVDRGV